MEGPLKHIFKLIYIYIWKPFTLRKLRGRVWSVNANLKGPAATHLTSLNSRHGFQCMAPKHQKKHSHAKRVCAVRSSLLMAAGLVAENQRSRRASENGPWAMLFPWLCLWLLLSVLLRLQFQVLPNPWSILSNPDLPHIPLNSRGATTTVGLFPWPLRGWMFLPSAAQFLPLG